MTPGRGNLDVLRGRLRDVGHDGLVVAYSGGADSAFLAVVASQALRDRVVAATAVSPSLAASERADAAAFAAEHGLRHVEVETDELASAAYRANDGERCAHCKDALMDALAPIAAETGAAIALGVNLDDLGDHRPGQAAAAARGAVFPLVDAGFTKADVRAASRSLGLRTWDKPAAPCLASRLPYGTPVSVELLGRVERAEAGVRALGLPRPAGAPPRRHGPAGGAAGRPRRGRRPAGGGGRRGQGGRLLAGRARPRGAAERQPQRRPVAPAPGGEVSATVVHVGNDRWGTSRCSTIAPLRPQLVEAAGGPVVVAGEDEVVGDGEQQRAAGGVGVAGAEHGLDLEGRPARVRGVGAPAVVDDAFEDRDGPDPHPLPARGPRRRP